MKSSKTKPPATKKKDLLDYLLDVIYVFAMTTMILAIAYKVYKEDTSVFIKLNDIKAMSDFYKEE